MLTTPSPPSNKEEEEEEERERERESYFFKLSWDTETDCMLPKLA